MARYYAKYPVVEARQVTLESIESICEWIMDTFVAQGRTDDWVSATTAGEDAYIITHFEDHESTIPLLWWVVLTGEEFHYMNDHVFRTRWQGNITIDEKFENLVARWEPTSRIQSSISHVAMGMDYQEMIAMGPVIIPNIIDKLKEGVGGPMWFWALRAITGRDVAVGHDTVDGAEKAWIDWYDKGML